VGGLPYDFDKTYKNVDWKVGRREGSDVEVDGLCRRTDGISAMVPFNELPNTTPTFSNEIKPSRLRAYTGRHQVTLVGTIDCRSTVRSSTTTTGTFSSKATISRRLSMPSSMRGKWPSRAPSSRAVTGVHRDQVNLNIGYSHARNKDFTTPNGQNYDGYQLAYAPDLTALIGYTHNIPIGEATLRATSTGLSKAHGMATMFTIAVRDLCRHEQG